MMLRGICSKALQMFNDYAEATPHDIVYCHSNQRMLCTNSLLRCCRGAYGFFLFIWCSPNKNVYLSSARPILQLLDEADK